MPEQKLQCNQMRKREKNIRKKQTMECARKLVIQIISTKKSRHLYVVIYVYTSCAISMGG